MPDYGNGIMISLPYTMPANGFIAFGLYKATVGKKNVYRNGVIIGSQYNSVENFYTCFTGLYMFYKGDVISADREWQKSSLFFYPMKGVN